MNNEMLLVVPSRGRPENIIRLSNALQNTGSKCDFIVAIDDDDSKLEEYLNIYEVYPIRDIEVGPRRKFAKTVNDVMMDYKDQYEYFAWMGDDHLPRTYQWDSIYLSKLKEIQVGVVYGNDLVQGENIATELAFTANIIHKLGYAIPPGFIHLYVDNYFMELGRSIGKLEYLPDIIVEHLHYSAGQAQEDRTYREANSPENWSHDQARFYEYVANELPNDAEKLKELL